jgi:type I site-specific restriction endonuclease
VTPVGDRHPVLSEQRNILVIADEAHRSQYDFIDGFGRHMRDALPNASFVSFTDTPIEKTDANTRAVFGDYISVYDIDRAVADDIQGAPARCCSMRLASQSCTSDSTQPTARSPMRTRVGNRRSDSSW